ncbi:MAG: ROK family protein [Alphaproteobacteria bacterium]
MRIGFDVGGTKIAGAAFDTGGATLAEVRADTPRSFDEVVDCLVDLCHRLADTAGLAPARVGLCMPGQITREGAILVCVNLKWLVGRPLRQALADRLGLPVAIANDGNCFALSEAVDGAGRDAPVVFGITLGTGVGAGLVIGRRIVTGANALAAEWGHVRFPFDPARDPEPIPCPCGRIGCVETMLRARSLHDEYRRLGGTAAVDAPDVADRAGTDDLAGRAVDTYCDRMARALVDVVHLLDPDVIVVGGGMSRLAALFERVPAGLERHAVGPIAGTRFLPAVHGGESGVRGAAAL